jgi:hypothetical protein
MTEETKSIWKRLAENWRSDRILFLLVAFVVFLTLITQVSSFKHLEPAELIIAALVSLAAGIIVVAIACLIRNSSTGLEAWNEPRKFFAWLTLFSMVGIAAGYAVYAASNSLQTTPDWLRKTVFSATAILILSFALGFVCMILAWIPPVRRLLTWLLQRRFYLLACLITLAALFYAEENWRGKRAWDNYRREWEAKGEHFDFASIIPPPVPDDQNFVMTPIWVETMKATLGPKNSRQWFGNNSAENGRTNFTDRLAISLYRNNDYSDSNLVFGAWQKAKPADLKPWQYYYRSPKVPKAIPANPNPVVTNEFPFSAKPQTPAADVLLALSKYDSIIEELREAAKLPYSRFPLNYNTDEPFAILLPQLSKMKVITQFLNLRTIAELEADQPENALADLKLAFRCNDAIHNETFLISQLVRIAIQSILMQAVWEGLAEQKWSDAQIAELENELGKQDYLADFHHSMRGERTGSIATIDYLRRNRNFQSLMGDIEYGSEKRNSVSPMEMLNAIGFYLIPDGWFYQTELTFAQMHERWIFPAVDLQKRLVSPRINARLTDESSKVFESKSANFLIRLLFPSLSMASKKFALIQAQVDLAHVACALERYRLAHGEYPGSLDQLAPQFITQVPHDLINGEPLQYRREAGGLFTLYSVGWNEKDDGGTVVFKRNSPANAVDTDQGDWVWRYPAK